MYTEEYLKWVKETQQKDLTGNQAMFAQWLLDNKSIVNTMGNMEDVFLSIRNYLKNK